MSRALRPGACGTIRARPCRPYRVHVTSMNRSEGRPAAVRGSADVAGEIIAVGATTEVDDRMFAHADWPMVARAIDRAADADVFGASVEKVETLYRQAVSLHNRLERTARRAMARTRRR